MKRQILILSMAVAALLFAACSGTKGRRFADETDAVFAEWNLPGSPGCALAVVSDGEIVYSRGYGMADLEHDIPVAPETVFYIGSESKQFVAACLLLLEEQGKLSLGDDIRKYVPELPSYENPITIRHCILHTSGLRDYFTLWSLAGVDYANFHPEMEVVDLITRQKELNFPPGEDRLYSNSGYLLLSVVIRRASGMSLADYAEKYIFEPLGMEDSHFHDDTTRIVKNRAQGYFRAERDTWGLLAFRFALVGSGGLYTTVHDLAKWDANFYDNTLGETGNALIQKMTTPGKLNSGEELSYACALSIGGYRGLPTVRHGGALGGYRSHMLRFPEERFTVIVLFNLADVNPGWCAEKVANIWLADRLEPPDEQPGGESAPSESDDEHGEEPFHIPAVKLAGYAGIYDSDEVMATYALTVDDGVLNRRVRSFPPVELTPVAVDRFDRDGIEFAFDRDTRGMVTGFRLSAGRVRNLRFERRQ